MSSLFLVWTNSSPHAHTHSVVRCPDAKLTATQKCLCIKYCWFAFLQIEKESASSCSLCLLCLCVGICVSTIHLLTSMYVSAFDIFDKCGCTFFLSQEKDAGTWTIQKRVCVLNIDITVLIPFFWWQSHTNSHDCVFRWLVHRHVCMFVFICLQSINSCMFVL